VDGLELPGVDLPGIELVREVLVEARSRGLLGSGSVSGHIEHAIGFGVAIELNQSADKPPVGAAQDPVRVLDLGSGAGLPGLVLATILPHTQTTLLDSSARRCEFLREAVVSCGLSPRVDVVNERAEVAGRLPGIRSSFDVVVVRSFGPPPVVAECGSPFLVTGGVMIVSEPPPDREDESNARWPNDGLRLLCLESQGTVKTEFTYRVIRQDAPCPEQFPRRTGIPSKRPLW
jgi:16S rRNA (guanine527-N7)-methyltransferase